jgi:hypothetical protein
MKKHLLLMLDHNQVMFAARLGHLVGFTLAEPLLRRHSASFTRQYTKWWDDNLKPAITDAFLVCDAVRR